MIHSYPYTRDPDTGLSTAVKKQFSDLLIGDFFDFIEDGSRWNSFYKRFVAIFARADLFAATA